MRKRGLIQILRQVVAPFRLTGWLYALAFHKRLLHEWVGPAEIFCNSKLPHREGNRSAFVKSPTRCLIPSRIWPNHSQNNLLYKKAKRKYANLLCRYSKTLYFRQRITQTFRTILLFSSNNTSSPFRKQLFPSCPTLSSQKSDP